MALPAHARNFQDPERLSNLNLNLPYGEPTIQYAEQTGSRQQDDSVFGNWANDLGSKLEILFKPLGLSPSNARIQPNMFNHGMYDSAKNIHAKPPLFNVRPESKSVDSS